ncbi:hypothetical protein [Actinoalloteichus hymeniacidonis]|uniref:hypothetical protein n=1 Tax=Actinoalloteichus hymeniacidonis TaxID=340345 RepID=UPI0012FBCAA1|nr:hypothetical protein [Actinoalloteichus hymeniacidonis]MBB5910309.1 hypothetical protein [Actinoalloteichus hymeniacidonis]
MTSAGRERRDRIMERTGDVLGRPRRGIGTLVVLGGLVAMVIGVVLAWRASSAGPIKVDTAFTPWGMGGVLAFAIGLLLTAGGRRWPLALIGLVFSAWALVVLTVDGAKLGTEATGSVESCTVEVRDPVPGRTDEGEPRVRNWVVCAEGEGFYLLTADDETTLGGQIEVEQSSIWPPVPSAQYEVGSAAIVVPVAAGGLLLLFVIARVLSGRDRYVG